jgi:hypothetical protein
MKRDDTQDRFDIGMRVLCIKPYEKLKLGSHYEINGCGDLENNMDSKGGNKKGYGFSVKYQEYDWKKVTNSHQFLFYYFTYEEMSEYFTSEYEDYKAYIRNQKIESIIIE